MVASLGTPTAYGRIHHHGRPLRRAATGSDERPPAATGCIERDVAMFLTRNAAQLTRRVR
jgi:hypothetical protein